MSGLKIYILPSLCLAARSRQSRGTRSGLEQGDLGGATADKPGELDTTAELPLGQLLLGDGVGVLSRVQAGDEAGGARVAAADVEGPANEGAVLVVVEGHRLGGVHGDAVLGGLDACQLVVRPTSPGRYPFGATYSHVLTEEQLSIGNRQRNGVIHVRAAAVGAEVPITDSRVASRVKV